MGVALADYVATLTGGFWRSTAWAPIADESTIANVAAAIAVGLNEESFSREFEAIVTYQPQVELRDLEDLRVSVVPGGSDIVRVTRAHQYERLTVEIGLQQRVETDAEIGRLMRLGDEILAWIERTRTFADARVIDVAKAPQYSAEHITIRACTVLITVSLIAELGE